MALHPDHETTRSRDHVASCGACIAITFIQSLHREFNPFYPFPVSTSRVCLKSFTSILSPFGGHYREDCIVLWNPRLAQESSQCRFQLGREQTAPRDPFL